MSGIPSSQKGSRTRISTSAPNSPKTPPHTSRLPGLGVSKKGGNKKQQEKATPEVKSVDPVSALAPSNEEQLPGALDITNPLPTTSIAHRDLDKCPCGQSLGTWKIDCSKCHQFWHINCLGLKGLTKSVCDKLVEYLCPFCYVAPVSTIVSAENGACYVCRNTLSLQQANSQHEVTIASSKLKAMESFCKAVEKVDLESLSKQMETVENLDLHLQHLLLDKDSLKQQQERVKKVDDTVSDLNHQLSQLQNQMTELLSQPQQKQECSSTLSEEFMNSINSQLEKILEEEPRIAEGLESLKASVGALEEATSSQTTTPEPVVQESRQDPSSEDQLSHGQSPVYSSEEEFITTEMGDQLLQLFGSLQGDFVAEGGRSVLYFGERYKYNGSNASNRDQPIPQAIEELMERVNSAVCTGDCPKVNSCLVNRFEGPDSHLPKHSDNEPTIHPESLIVTLSLGSECTLKFSDQVCGNVVLEHRARPCSVYSMTRKSQEFFEHGIDPGSMGDGTRYSLTFRSISWKNRNATCILGDSNTGGLKFGNDSKRSFGSSFPGKQFPTPLVGDINPYNTCGYSNVVLMCGINNLKSDVVKNSTDVRSVFNLFVSKIEQIQKVNPRAHIFACPVLPTKRSELNRKGVCFNMMLMNDLLPSNFGVSFVDGFQNFLDENGLLSRDLSRELYKRKYPDCLHLNWKGLAKLGVIIRNTVLRRKSGGIDKRTRTRVDGTSFRDVVTANRAPEHDGYQAS